MTLKITNTKTITADLQVKIETMEEPQTVKTITLAIDHNGVTSVNEIIYNRESYELYQKEMREDERKVRELQLKEEDLIKEERDKALAVNDR